jgi:hypothetical protein
MTSMNMRLAEISGMIDSKANARWDGRSRRVAVLMLGVIALSVADLFITLAYLRAQWMMEANPIAVFVIKSTDSAWGIAAFKALTVLVCVSLLMKARRHLVAEIAAWCAVGILTVLSVMWHNYANHFEDHAGLILAQDSTPNDLRLGLPQ